MKHQTLFIIPGACSLGSMVALELLDQPYQIGITTAEIRASEAFHKINPLGKVGALADNGRVVYENLAILLYLIDKNPNSKIALGLNTPERIETYKWLSYLSSTLHVAFGPLFYPTGFVDESAVEMFKTHAIKRLQDILSYIDTHLSIAPYFIGNTPTIVDGQAYGLLRWTKKFDLLNDKLPNIQKFLATMGKLNAVQNALNIEQNKTDALVDSSFAGYYNFD